MKTEIPGCVYAFLLQCRIKEFNYFDGVPMVLCLEQYLNNKIMKWQYIQNNQILESLEIEQFVLVMMISMRNRMPKLK